MAELGINVSRDGRHGPALVRSLGATWIRIVAMPEHDLTDYFQRCRATGLKILLVHARESGGDVVLHQRRYGSLVDAVQVGNEPDLTGPSSWTMSPVELASLGRAVRAIFPTTPLVCAGLASGHANWLDGADLSWCDALAVHPYLKDAPNPGDLEDLQDVPPLLESYQRFGKPLLVTEWGWWGDDERRGEEEVRDMIGWAGKTDLVEVFFYFCLSDEMVPPFGLLRADGSEKPQARAFREQAARAVHSLWPEVRAPAPAPVGPDPWRWWDAPTIAATIRCPEGAIREHWPRLVEQMVHCGIYDAPTAAAMLATVAIETAHRFAPIDEFRNADGSIPAIWHTYDGGPEFHGRGFIQLTHRSNYARYGPLIAELWGTPMVPELDLVARPERALDADVSAAVAALYFRDHGGKHARLIPHAAARGDWREVRRLVQGGSAGLGDFSRYASALVALARPGAPSSVDPRDERIAAYELALKTLRDDTLPSLRARLDEAQRIVEQFVGPAA